MDIELERKGFKVGQREFDLSIFCLFLFSFAM